MTRRITWASTQATGHRTCYRNPSGLMAHTVDYPRCDCLRTELPSWAQSLSSGALGTPERNHTCPACNGSGRKNLYGWLACCPRCAGCGERTAKREPADHAFPAETNALDQFKKPRISEKSTQETSTKQRAQSDRAIRERVSAARKTRRLGVR